MIVRRIGTTALVVAVLSSVFAVFGGPGSVADAAPGDPPAEVGQPPADYVIEPDSYFSFPNRSVAERMAIRDRVLHTIESVWGGPRTASGAAEDGNGTIRIATWTFNDWEVARALVAARDRGVSVQVVAAVAPNVDHAPWRWLRQQLGSHLYEAGHPETRDYVSFARQCRGACRGHGGTPHSKYFLFDNVGSGHVHDVVVQGSMNLSYFAFSGQWNQVNVTWSPDIYSEFMDIYRETRIGRPVSPTYRSFTNDAIRTEFFPFPNGNAANDPVMQLLDRTRCTGSTAVGTARGRTRIRIVQYSVYGDRGVWIARKLRRLWNAGCDVQMIYAVSSRPVISVLRSRGGRGPVPLKQSVITNRRHQIIRYNHSKWFTITGNWGGTPDAYVTMTGSANWSRFAFTGDEQVQTIQSQQQALRHNGIFNITWRQKSSHRPRYATQSAGGRVMWSIPEEPTWGRGIYKYLSADGD